MKDMLTMSVCPVGRKWGRQGGMAAFEWQEGERSNWNGARKESWRKERGVGVIMRKGEGRAISSVCLDKEMGKLS